MVSLFERYAPDLLVHCKAALTNMQSDLDFLRLDETAYEQCDGISLDYAILEKASNIKCVCLDAGWQDLGSWPALWGNSDKDDNGNVLMGNIRAVDVSNSYVRVDCDTQVAVSGVDDMYIIVTRDAILVASGKKASEITALIGKEQIENQNDLISHERIYRPWGWYEVLSKGVGYLTKRLMVKPGARLSLQSHQHRSEHWVVVTGTVEATLEDDVSVLCANQSVYIPANTRHRLANSGPEPAMLIEVQVGQILDENDITRFQDDFNRLDT